MADPEIKITFKSDSSNVEKDLERIEQKLEKMPKRIPLGQGRWNPNGPSGPNGPKNPLKEEYEAGYSAMQEELAALAEQYAQLEVQTEKLTNAYREELSALDENSQGYAENKKELEALIAKGETLEKTLAAQSASVEKQSISLQNLNDKVGKIGYQKAIQEQNKMGLSLGVMTKTFEQTEQQISNYAEAWNNKLAKAQEKATKDEKKYQATLKVTGKTYEELTQLYSQLLEARANAKSVEELKSIDAQLIAVCKNIASMGREAQLSGAKMIGSQTSVLGVMQEVNRQWRNGVLTLKGLTQGIKLFAKSTVVLAAIQFAWEGISKILEKIKIDFLGASESAKEASEKAKHFADATREAGQAAIEAGMALGDKFYNDEIRAKSENNIRSFTRLKDELQANVTAMQNLTKSRINDMETAAVIAGDDMMLKKLQLENDFINGKIDATEKAIALKRLESDAATAADNLKLEKAREELELQKKINAETLKTQAAANRKVAELRQKGENLMTPEEIKVYEEQRKSIEQELFEMAESDRTGGDAQKAKNQFRRIQLWGLLDRLEDKRNASGRNTVAEYEAWKMEYDAAVTNASELDKKYNAENAKMYAQEQSFERLKKDTERRADTRKKVNDIEEKNINDKKKQAERDKKNQEKISALSSKVSRMTYKELKEEEENIQKRLSGTSNEKRKSRLEGQEKVISNELKRRREQAKRKAENSIPNTPAESKKEQKNMDDAAKLLEIIATRETYTNAQFEQAKKLLASAVKTSGSGDNAVVYQLIDFMNSTATAIGNEKRSRSKLAKEVARLKAKMANPSL